ncbi:uncharacterized protein FIBRA_02705 [Fibroporia radiculosa]|uniref:20S-pre-rRNA D-site endonuclease NOB1 n=1 Tax=Fibroporia radiculosa TaxID=599839 RepID=J4I974_9APHY|nr:uncharacterized protein FIBRA_02705 [Fibroporia radiculosa]CCM00666.1 predicted protein [Fibroporia radiculosa]
MANSTTQPACEHLVLDAGPLLSLSPLRGLAETYYTVPQVLDELKDKRAREHFERLGLSAGVQIQVQGPDPTSLAHVIQFAKKTGDYSVLSHADLCILALTYALDTREKTTREENERKKGENVEATLLPPKSSLDDQSTTIDHGKDIDHESERHIMSEDDSAEEPPASEVSSDSENVELQNGNEAELVYEGAGPGDDQSREPLDVELHRISNESSHQHSPAIQDVSSPSDGPNPTNEPVDNPPLYDDPSDSDDGEGEWITPSNVALHKSRALDLLPSATGSKGKRKQEKIPVGCMTADFAMQNVLLQMKLGLVSVDGKRIQRVKSWVLRCHACFKICKDSSRKFCPSCGNPSLLRASVTISSPDAGPDTPAMQVHLKKNFQYKTRGTIYSIPAPKPGSARTGPGEGLVLREDQLAWVRAKKRADGKREREERRMLTAASERAGSGAAGTVVSSWMDPDWVPEIMSAGVSGKGRSVRSRGMDGDMPVVGYGKKNPNERRRK